MTENINKSVSVIIPTHNRASLVIEAIDSVIRQDIENCWIEIIVIDDGSTDNTKDVLKIYDDKIRYIYQENQGAGVARNRGIEEARGEWISFLDSDDRWLPHKLSLQFRVLEKFPHYKIIHSNFYTFEGSEIIIPKGLEYWVKTIRNTETTDWSSVYSKKYKSCEYNVNHNGRIFDIYTGNIFAVLLYALYGSCLTMLIHGCCMKEQIRFAENFPTWEDYWFICKLSEYNDIIFIDVPTAENRGHRGPRLTTRSSFIDPLRCHIEICKNIYMNSESPFKPENKEISKQCKNIHMKLMKEYIKIGNLASAKSTRRAINDMGYAQSGIEEMLYKMLTYLPFNVVSHLVSMKKKIAGS